MNIKILAVILLALPLITIGEARMFLASWKNLSKQEVGIYADLDRKIALGTVKPGQTITLNKEIMQRRTLGGNFFDIYASPIPHTKDDRRLEIISRVREDTNLITIRANTVLANIFSTEILFAPGEDINAAIIHLDVETQGDNFEQANIIASKKVTAKPLGEQALHNIAKQVKQGTITLEKAKSILPIDLHEKLEDTLFFFNERSK